MRTLLVLLLAGLALPAGLGQGIVDPEQPDRLMRGEYIAILVEPAADGTLSVEFNFKHWERAAFHDIVYVEADHYIVSSEAMGGSRGMNVIIDADQPLSYHVEAHPIVEPLPGGGGTQIVFPYAPWPIGFVFSYAGDVYDTELRIHSGTLLNQTSGDTVWAAWPRDFAATASGTAEYLFATTAAANGVISASFPERTLGFFGPGHDETGQWLMAMENDGETERCPCKFNGEKLGRSLSGDATFHLSGARTRFFDMPILWLVSPELPTAP